MRVLFVSLIPAYWGGSERLWSEAAHAAVQRGWRAAAFFPYFKSVPPIQALADAGVRLYFGSARPERWWRRAFRRPADRLTRFRRCLAAFRPDVVVLTQGSLADGVLEMETCRSSQQRYVVINQAVETGGRDDDALRAIRDGLRGATKVYFVSQENRAAAVTLIADELANAEVISNAYACSYDVSCPWPADDRGLQVAVVGRIEPSQKGQDLLLEALRDQRWQDRPLDVNIYGDGPARTDLEAHARRLGLGRVHFLGSEPDVTKVWRHHHALVLPSRFEGQSLAMLEAMLHARPVIATPVGGTHGLIIDGQTGFMATGCDAPALAVALERAWAGRHNWRSLGINAAARVRAVVSPAPGRDFIDRLASIAADRMAAQPQ